MVLNLFLVVKITLRCEQNVRNSQYLLLIIIIPTQKYD